MNEHFCQQEETIGKIKEFINNSKGMRGLLSGIVLAILLQVGTFLFLWGRLTYQVESHEKSITNICEKLDNVTLVGYVHAGTNKEVGHEIK